MTARINILLSSLLIVLSAVSLFIFGRGLWCPAGDLIPWSFDVWSQHNSQHVLDWYTPSHFSHGLLFFLAIHFWIPDRFRIYGSSICVFMESGWELLENSNFIIQRYREATIALDYFGDSVLNSVSDILWCALGYQIASRLRPGQILFLFLGLELMTLYFIRDNLSLNVLMLIYPVQSIKDWQMQIAPQL